MYKNHIYRYHQSDSGFFITLDVQRENVVVGGVKEWGQVREGGCHCPIGEVRGVFPKQILNFEAF